MTVLADRWPLLLGAALCWTTAFAVYRQTGNPDDGTVFAYGLTVLGSVLVGAFITDLARRRNDP